MTRRHTWGVGVKYSSTVSSTFALHGGGLLTPRPSRFTPGERSVAPTAEKAGRVQGPVRTGEENVAPHRGSKVEPSSAWRVAIPSALSQLNVLQKYYEL